MSKASCGALNSPLNHTLDCNHIDEDTFNVLLEKVLFESKKNSSFLNHLYKSEYKGSKFN
ncbi:hypothetical protein [Arenibacter sp. H213]|uniref:Uncharacterized protein n=1 Tax=Arenibacter antarcticus TaxID=2040469 RepID=A0ABW5VG71_9FLAO